MDSITFYSSYNGKEKYILSRYYFIMACETRYEGVDPEQKNELINSWLPNDGVSPVKVLNIHTFLELKNLTEQLEKEDFNNKVNEFIN